jgi:S1-C subfamily serine protease
MFAFVGSKPHVATAEITSETVERIWPAVVRINGVVQIKQGSRTSWEPVYTCSGSIISPDGFILTNYHCTDVVGTLQEVAPELKNPQTKLLISLTKKDDEPPVPSFFAEVRAQSPYDGGLDVAVLQITEDLNGKPIDGSSLHLPTVTIGDSDALKLGNRIHLFGYQGIGGDTITFTSGDVSGFSYKQGVEGRAWIKHTATAAGGNSGGTAVNEKGELIGIPTQMGYGDAENFADCRRLADTNGDGVIDEKDSCIPGGGFINAVRPVNLAKPFIKQALDGVGPIDPTNPNDTPTATATPKPNTTPTPGAGNAKVARTFFASGVDEDDQPTTIVKSLPSKATDLVFFFDYSGFEEGVNFHPRLFVDNKEIEDVWPEEPWQGYTSGQSWIGFLESELPDGTYKFQLDYNDKTVATNQIKIGGNATKVPSVSDIVFSGGDSTESQGNHLISGDTTELTANFKFANMTRNQKWQAVWYQQDADTGAWTQLDKSDNTYSGTGGAGTAKVTGDTPFAAGLYRLDINFGSDLAGTGMVTVLGKNDGPGPNGDSSVGPIKFASAIDEEGLPVDEGTKFDSGIERLYGIFDYAGLKDGMTFNITWLIDGEETSNQDFEWNLGAEGNANVYIYGSPDPSPLPDGTYELRLSVEGQELQRGSATIGDGSANPTPTPGPDSNEGVTVKGTIVDAVSGKPIEGAAFGVLVKGVTVDQFDGSDDQILDAAVTDRNGEFALTVPLTPGTAYSVLAVADGYKTFGQDDVVFSDKAETVEINLELQKR